jgi:hypothetical protein
MYYLDQIGLVGHHLVNVFVGRWDFVNHAFVFAALDALCLRYEVSKAETSLSFSSGHDSTRPV